MGHEGDADADADDAGHPPTAPATGEGHGRVRRLSRNVIALGWVSFFTDLASEMLYPVMPLFLIGTLGASPALLGLIDGIAEGGEQRPALGRRGHVGPVPSP